MKSISDPLQYNQPYHIPVYNYGVKNAYYNPGNYLGPNFKEDNLEEKNILRTNDKLLNLDFDYTIDNDKVMNLRSRPNSTGNPDLDKLLGYLNSKDNDLYILRSNNNKDDILESVTQNISRKNTKDSNNAKKKRTSNKISHKMRVNDKGYSNFEFDYYFDRNGKPHNDYSEENIDFIIENNKVPNFLDKIKDKVIDERKKGTTNGLFKNVRTHVKVNDEYKMDDEFDDINVYVNVIKDMITVNNKDLENYDWLATTVDVISSLNKLLGLM